MKIFELERSAVYNFDFLTEANIFNKKEEYEGYSIESYLTHYANQLGSQESKNMFIKKVGKLLMNDERFHNVVRKLPPNAPDWARQAVRKKELVYFAPNDNLNDSMQHIAHYIEALEHDIKGDNKDQIAFANREIGGFGKAENLDLIIKKSQEYFKRGTKKTSRSVEGMIQIHDSGNGFKWYLLQTPEAYKREGKALQNCIGQIYTRNSSKNSGYELVVMRKGNNDTVVAARIQNKENTISEMKGKNNKPPIEKYMRYVIDFMNKRKLKLGSGAEHDFRRAGYFWIEEQMYTRTDAIKKFIKKDSIAKFPDGNELIRVKAGSQSPLVADLLRDLYPELHTGYGTKPEIYELRNSNNNPLISGAVQKKKLETLQRHTTLRESLIESVIQGRAAREFVGELIRRKIINSVNDKMARDLFWNERIKINHTTGAFDPVKPEKEIQTDKKHITWEKHSDDDAVKMIQQSLRGSGVGSDDDKWEPMGIHQVYITKEKMVDNEHDDPERDAKHYALAKTKDNVLVPILINLAMDRVSTTDVGTGTGGDENQIRRTKLINSAVALANKEDSKLTQSFKYNSGIVRNLKTKKYEVFNPKIEKLEGDPSGIRIDLSKVPRQDRFAAINRVVVSGHIRARDKGTSEDNIHDHDTEVQLKLDYALSGEKYARGQNLWSSEAQEDASNWEGHDRDKLYTQVFNGDTPDTIYLVKVKYGKDKSHEVFMLSDGHKVVEIDGATERHQFQDWGDHEMVANQLNDFANANNLTFDPSAIGDKEELRISRGRIATGSMIQKEQLDELRKQGHIGQERSDEVTLKDGLRVVRMDQEEQSEWVRRGLDVRSLAGEGWKVINKKGTHFGIIVVAKSAITALYGPDFDWDDSSGSMIPGTNLLDMTNKQSINPELLKGAISARKEFKWKVKQSAQFTVKPHSDQHRLLRDAGNNQTTTRKTPDIHKAEDLGLITIKSQKIKLTPTGKKVLKLLDSGKNANALAAG